MLLFINASEIKRNFDQPQNNNLLIQARLYITINLLRLQHINVFEVKFPLFSENIKYRYNYITSVF